MLYIKELEVNYKAFSLKVVDVYFRKGINILIGPNGAGKTTLLETVLTLRKAKSNKVIFKSEQIEVMLKNNLKEKMAFISSELFLYKRKSVEFHRKLWAILYPNFSNNIFRDCIDTFCIDLDKKVYELSSGQKRLVSLALSISYKPELFILDEPFAFLDIAQSNNVLQLINKHIDLSKSCVIISSHLVQWLEEFKFNALAMNNGKVVDKGILNNYAQYF